MPDAATNVEGTVAVRVVLLTYVAARSDPPKSMAELVTKFVPVTVRVNAMLPIGSVVGDRVAIVGTGFCTVTVNVGALPKYAGVELLYICAV